MADDDNYDILVIGSGEAGKYLAWTMAGEGHRTAVVERKLIGGSCPSIACLPSKNIIHSAKVRPLARRAAEFGVEAEPAATNMKGVQDRKRAMVEGLRQLHLDRYRASGAELIMGEARFTAPRTVNVQLDEGGARRISGDRGITVLLQTLRSSLNGGIRSTADASCRSAYSSTRNWPGSVATSRRPGATASGTAC